MHILFLSRWYPYPPNNGSKLRIYHLLRGLAEHHAVTLFSFVDTPDVAVDLPALEELCAEVRVFPLKLFDPHSPRARLGFLSLKPRSVVDTFSSELAQAIQTHIDTKPCDVVVASQLDTAVYQPYFKQAPALFEEVEIGIFYEKAAKAHSLTQRLRYGLSWYKRRRFLRALLDDYEVCTVVSSQERRLLAESVGEHVTNIEVVPNCIDVGSYQTMEAEPQPDRLIFTGSFSYRPNYEAMVWFIQEVFPLILAEAPQCQLFITGDHQNLTLPSMRNVTLTGFVDDIRSLIASSWLSLAPIWTGGGTRLKILEAMALHTPVVSTTKGAEGIDVKDEQDILLADTPKAFAEAVIRLLQEQGLRRRLADGAYQLVRDQYNWSTTLPRFLQLVEQMPYA